ncbi:hypothetical protein [Yokenella regensburgei]|uniref:hypothetical protein n=1 Tax=Yokenella regensburgei TaxID=158877 RepID=UPI003ED9141C
MKDKIHKSAAANLMVTGKSGWDKTCLQSQIMPVLPSRSDVASRQQRYGSEDREPLADALRKNCNAWIILKSGDEYHGE